MDDNEHSRLQRQKRHLRGWLSYAFASEVFVVVSLTLFLPICLEQFARDNGRLSSDHTQPCLVPAGESDKTRSGDKTRCVVNLGWLWIDSASFSLYVYSASVALQALTVISMGSIADRPTYRKRLLLGFAFSGATAAALFLLLSSKSLIWPMSALLAMVANVGFGASVVAMNAYLPLLARESEEAHSLQHETGLLPARQNRSNIDESSSAPLLSSGSTHDDEPTASSREAHAAAISRSTARISSHGIAIGYAAGITLLILALIPVTLLKGSTFSLRLAIGASGIWWALGSIPAAIWLPSEGEMRREQAASAHAGEWEDEDEVKLGVGQEVKQAWVKLGRTLHPKEVRELYNTFKYLAAWFLLSDGFTTITSTAILFGKTALGMPASRLVIVGVLTPTAGIAGALIWPRIQQAFGWSNLRVLMTLVGLASLIPVYGCLGFIPFFGQGRAKFGGLTTQEEMFGLAVYFGAVYGAFQSYARALYAELIPPGEEARWYGLFSITDKSSSFLGPLAVGIISDVTGNIRYSFFFLVIMVWAALPILATVNAIKGKEDAQRYARRARR